MNVVIVESAAKAKTINKYLGPGYKVIASYGHVRDLPAKNGSVEPDNDFAMHWDVDGKSQKIMREIAEAVKKADKLILATDPDREGEAISWHILRNPERQKGSEEGHRGRAGRLQRYHQAIDPCRDERAARDRSAAGRRLFGAPRARLSRRLHAVARALAQAARRPFGWPRAVRALRLVCDREAEIEAFKTDEYWTIEALLATAKDEDVKARLVASTARR